MLPMLFRYDFDSSEFSVVLSWKIAGRFLEGVMNNPTFQGSLEVIEAVPEEQRWSLMDIVRRRLVQERMNEIARSIVGFSAARRRGGHCDHYP